MERHVANTRKVVELLAAHPLVERIAYPELHSHPDHALAQRLLPKGCGAVFSFDLKGTRAAGRNFVETLTVFSHLANVGDAKSLVIHPASTTHFRVPDHELAAAGIDPAVDRPRRPGRSTGRSVASAQSCFEGGVIMMIGESPSQIFGYTGGKPFDATKPCIVFIHGAQHDHSVWILQSRYLAHHGYSVLAVDLPGHGRSDGPLATTVEAIADRIAAALTPLATSRYLLVGHSMGSLTVLEVARRLCERAAGVALLGTAAPMRVSDALLAATREDPATAMQMINVWSHSASIAPFAVRPGNPGPGFNVVWENLRLMERLARVNGAEVLPVDFAA
jgi:pimeloyl-ACP methyl ester carboxylesterase